MKKNLKKGFTLTELVVVIVIIGILASVLIPTLTSYITRSRKSAAEQEATGRLQEFMAYVLEWNNEDWFEINEYVKSSTIVVSAETNPDYYVVFEKGQVKVNLTDDTAPSSYDAKLTFSVSGASTTYKLELKDHSATNKLGKLHSDASTVTAGCHTLTLVAESAAVKTYTPNAA